MKNLEVTAAIIMNNNEVLCKQRDVNYSYPDFKITMQSFICNVSSREIDRKEHISEVWLPIDRLNILDWAPADVHIVNKLMENLSC